MYEVHRSVDRVNDPCRVISKLINDVCSQLSSSFLSYELVAGKFRFKPVNNQSFNCLVCFCDKICGIGLKIN